MACEVRVWYEYATKRSLMLKMLLLEADLVKQTVLKGCCVYFVAKFKDHIQYWISYLTFLTVKSFLGFNMKDKHTSVFSF